VTWLGMGDRAVRTLIENLFYYLLAAQNAALPTPAARAQAEIIEIGTPAVPYLLAMLRMREFTDRTGAKQRVDEMTRRTAAETLVLLGSGAVDPTLRALPRMPEASRRIVTRALVDLVDPRTTRALMGLLDDPSFQVAAEAAWALRSHPGAEVSRRLLAVFSDPRGDRFVRQQAAKSLNARKDAEIVLDLVDVMERAIATDDIAVARAAGVILRATTGLAVKSDPAAWRRALKAER
jgi:hypothetical protein